MFTSPSFKTVKTYSACLLLRLLACIQTARAVAIRFDREMTDADTLVFDMIWAYPDGRGTVQQSNSYPYNDTVTVWEQPTGDPYIIQGDGFYYEVPTTLEYKKGGSWMTLGINAVIHYRVYTSPSKGMSYLDDTDIYLYDGGGFWSFSTGLVTPIEGNPYGARFTFERGPRTVPDGLPTVYAVVTFALLLGYDYRRRSQKAVALNG